MAAKRKKRTKLTQRTKPARRGRPPGSKTKRESPDAILDRVNLELNFQAKQLAEVAGNLDSIAKALAAHQSIAVHAEQLIRVDASPTAVALKMAVEKYTVISRHQLMEAVASLVDANGDFVAVHGPSFVPEPAWTETLNNVYVATATVEQVHAIEAESLLAEQANVAHTADGA